MSDTITTFRHPTLPVSAPADYWHPLGYTTYSNTDIVALGSGFRSDSDELVMLGVGATGANDERALVWAMSERNRRNEERTRVTAQAREAEAIKDLANAIRTSAEDTVLAKILGRLSERTQYAVRTQLGRTHG